VSTDTRRLADLRTDPANSAIFDPLEGQDLAELADSIKENGIINPITIRPDGSIIAGEQRYRAAGMAGLVVVPVVVLDVSDQQVEVLRIEENLRRRGLKPSETARAIRRLYELHGITENKGGRPSKETPPPVSGVTEPKKAGDIARDAGMSPAKARTLNRIADLIGPLMRLLDHGVITQTMAYGFAQRPTEEQEEIAASLAGREEELHSLRAKGLRYDLDMQAAVKRIRAEKDAELERMRAETAELSAEQLSLVEQVTAEKDRELARVKAEEEAKRRELEQDNRQLKKDLADHARVEHWKRHDALHTGIQKLERMMTLSPQAAANAPQGIEALRGFLESDRETAEAGAEWLRAYAHALGARLGAAPTGLRSVK